MGKRSIKQLAYLSEHIGKYRASNDLESPLNQSEANIMLSLIPMPLIMNNPRVRTAISQQKQHNRRIDVGIRYGKESLAFGYLVGMVYNHLREIREKVVGLRGLSDYHFDTLINCWVLAQLSGGVFKLSQLIKTKRAKKYFNTIFKDLQRYGLIQQLTASEVHDITGLVVPSHMLSAKYYKLTRECDKTIDEFNLMFARVYKDFTRNCWVSDLERL